MQELNHDDDVPVDAPQWRGERRELLRGEDAILNNGGRWDGGERDHRSLRLRAGPFLAEPSSKTRGIQWGSSH